jgi:hypothetical protein
VKIMTEKQIEILVKIAVWLDTEAAGCPLESPEVPMTGDDIAVAFGISEVFQSALESELARRREEAERQAAEWAERRKAERAKAEAEYESRPETIAQRAAVAAMTDTERYEHNKATLDVLRNQIKQRRLERFGNVH